MLTKKCGKSAEDFWREYEEKTGEKVLERGLGKYITGWDHFDQKNWGGIWGLVINTSGGFRFHHFPQNSWVDSIVRHFSDTGQVKEKTIFIPNEKITSIDIKKETKWWKRIFSSLPPQIIVRYTDEAGQGKRLSFEAEFGTIR